MRKQFNEIKCYKIIGIFEMIMSVTLTSLFFYLILTDDAPKTIESLYASVVFVFTFGMFTFVASIWFLSYKPKAEENNRKTDKNDL